MTRQTSAPLTHLNLSAANREARGIADMVTKSGEIILDPPYQRGSVWTTDQRIALVRSWLTGIPVPAVVLNDRSNNDWVTAHGDPGVAAYACVDGRQRIETAVAWFTGALAVPASWFLAKEVESTVDTDDGPYVTHLGLTLVGRRFMNRRAQLPLIEAKVGSEAAEADLYLLLNGGGTPQTDADLANAARYASPSSNA